MLAFYTPKIKFTKLQVADMLTMQGKANDVMSDAWRTSCNCDIQYYRAAHKEASEAIDHEGWKWWKKFTADIKQRDMELIDILHFALSHKFREHIVNELGEKTDASNVDMIELAQGAAETLLEFDCSFPLEQIGKYASDDAYEKLAMLNGEIDIQKFPIVDLLELFMYNTLLNAEPDWATLMGLFDAAGLNADQAYKKYIGKNVLNVFRTSNGQRTNTYKKIWAGREDNEYLSDFLADYPERTEENTVEQMLEDLLAYLQTTYDKHLADNTAVLG